MSYVQTRPIFYGMGASGSRYVGTIGGGLLQAAPFTGPAAPFVALAGSITEMLASFGIGSGCGQTCVLTSQFANQAEGLLRQNRDAYLAFPQPRPASARTAALANFDQIWNWLRQQCSNPQLGDAGVRCISDRQVGACKWKDTSGQCFNWFSGYRDPIANDTNVVQDSSPLSAIFGGSSILGGSGDSSSLLPLGLIAALVVAGVML